ncbi:MAG: HAD-IA family hydrolase [Nitrospiria bacterium]
MTIRAAVKGVFFDAGDTLFEAAEPIGVYYSRVAGKYGVQVDADTLDQRFKTAFKAAPPLSFPGVAQKELERLEYAWWRNIVQTVFDGIHFPQFEAYFEALYRLFEEKDTWRCFPEVESVLRDLRRAGYILGIISNFDSRLLSISAKLGLRTYFDTIVFSSGAGAAKPRPEIFEAALKKTGFKPEETLYVGDHPKHDVKGARAAGMRAILLDRAGLYNGRGGIPVISDLRALGQYLELK